jgi:membrane dipeptidase
VHVTVAYHEAFRPTVDRIVEWHWRLRDHADLIAPGRNAADLEAAQASGRTAIVFGLQNPLPIEDDLGLVQVLHLLGIRFMQLTYNNQSLLGCGWMEAEDSGLTAMGREVVAEMNRLGMAIDLSHSGERTTLEAIAASRRPVTISHANPAWFRATGRNKSDRVLRALAERGGMLGLSLYPHHLSHGPDTTLAGFCEMAARVAALVGVRNLGIGSDLCQDQPDSAVQWMRAGRWTHPGPEAALATFPAQPKWFRGNLDFPALAPGLRAAGFSADEAALVLGGNWRRFMGEAFAPEPAG